MRAGIQTRLLLITTIVLGTFLSLAGVVLDRSFQASTVNGAREQLRLVIYSLMGAVQEDEQGFRFGAELPEPRLHQPSSGLYARIDDFQGRPTWKSPSAIITAVNFPAERATFAGEFLFTSLPDGHPDAEDSRFFLSYAVIWGDSEDEVLTFTVGTDQQPFRAAIAGFRRNLYVGLGAVTLLFVIAQYLAVRWGLRPLRAMAGEIRELEDGQRESLSAGYPSELEGLAENLDRFIAHEQRSRTRYRKAMEDLAHSLKTPLAVMRNELEHPQVDGGGLMSEQLDRMESTVTHQLSRAAVSGPVIVGRPVNISSLVDRLVRALNTAYASREIQVEQRLPLDLSVRGDERDIMEMLGNVLENAFKYTRSKVIISGEGGGPIEISVEDDGPGIDPALRERVLNRGTRADQIQPGQGIGLAMVHDLVGVYQGKLVIGESVLGGALIKLILP